MTMPARSAVNVHASSDDFEFASLNEAKNYRAELLRRFAPFLRGRVLEIGAGIGQFTRELKGLSAISDLVAVEPDARFHPRLAEVVGEANLIQGLAADVDHLQRWEALVSVNVLEHIEHDREELARYHTLLRARGGSLCLFVPARPELYAPLDRDFGHFRRYTKRELRRKLETEGFAIRQLRYFNGLGYFAWWFSFCVLKRREFNPAAVRFYDRILFPVTAWGENHLCAPPFGQSLLAIATAVDKSTEPKRAGGERI